MSRSRLDALTGRRAVVTGGASGLGRELCLQLGRKGWRVAVVDIDGRAAQETVRLVEREGGSARSYLADVGRPGDVKAFADRLDGDWGGVDLLVNCAGVAAMGIFEEIPLEDWHWAMDANLFGVVHCCREFIPRMKAQGAGYILNIASIAGPMSQAEWAPYSVSKAGVISISETLKVELAGSGVGITVVCPIYFDSNLTAYMRYTDRWQKDYLETAFRCARMKTPTIAARALEGAERGRLYVVPQSSARMLFAIKRSVPTLWYGAEALLNRLGILRRFLMLLSRARLI